MYEGGLKLRELSRNHGNTPRLEAQVNTIVYVPSTSTG